MKPIQIIAGLVLSAALVSPVHAITGNDLKEACDDDEFHSEVRCTSYIAGAADSIMRLVASQWICTPPEGVQYRQITAIVEKYIRDHPKNLHYDASSLVEFALKGAFPCSK